MKLTKAACFMGITVVCNFAFNPFVAAFADDVATTKPILLADKHGGSHAAHPVAHEVTHEESSDTATADKKEVSSTTTKSTTVTRTVTQVKSESASHKNEHAEKAEKNSKDKSNDNSGALKPLDASSKKFDENVNKLFASEGDPKHLTDNDIRKLSEKADLKGQEAATLAAIVIEFHNMSNPSDTRFTQEQLLRDFKNPNSSLHTYYLNALANINSVRALPDSEKLFGPKGLSVNTHIIQGSESDCYFLSAINSILHIEGGPEKLQGMIQQGKKPDEFTVNFPGYSKPISVKLTEAELGMYSHVVKGGEWLAVLSVAEAERRRQMNLNPEITMQPGFQTQTFKLLNGKKYVLKNLPEQLTPKQLEWYTNTITTALANNVPIGIETDDHDLSIIGFQNGVITIKNPWGTTSWYNPRTGGSSYTTNEPTSKGPWYSMKNGIFTISINNISDGFTQIAYHPEKDSDTGDAPAVVTTTSTSTETTTNTSEELSTKEKHEKQIAGKDYGDVKSCTIDNFIPMGCGGH